MSILFNFSQDNLHQQHKSSPHSMLTKSSPHSTPAPIQVMFSNPFQQRPHPPPNPGIHPIYILYSIARQTWNPPNWNTYPSSPTGIFMGEKHARPFIHIASCAFSDKNPLNPQNKFPQAATGLAQPETFNRSNYSDKFREILWKNPQLLIDRVLTQPFPIWRDVTL